MIKKLPSAAFLHECLRYDKRTGFLHWRKRPESHFASSKVAGSWNTKYAGTRAFTCINDHGYYVGRINGTLYFSHRVIWKLVTRKEPPPIIDHKDRKHSNNIWTNLREANSVQNMANTTKPLGVSFIESKGRWYAYAMRRKKTISLGYYKTKSEAFAARRGAVAVLHGEFAP